MEKLSIERSIWIAAPRERVWQAITDPQEVQHWFSHGTEWQLTGPQVGGKLSVVDPKTGLDLFTQIIEQYDPPHQVSMRSAPRPPETPLLTTWTLEEENGGTRVSVNESGYERMPRDARQARMDQDAMGFGAVLDNIKAHVDGVALSYPQGF